VPRKSGHTRNADLTIIQYGGRCPDLSGSAGALRIGHGKKRHLRAHSPVSFKELKCYPKRFRVVRPVLSEPEAAREGEGIQEMGMAL